MSLLDANFNDLPELHHFEEDAEVELRITAAEVTPRKKDPEDQMLHITFESTSDPLADDIHHYLTIPAGAKQNTEPKEYVRAMGRIKTFCQAFRYDLSNGLDTEGLIGCTGFAIVGFTEADGQYGAKNTIKKFV